MYFSLFIDNIDNPTSNRMLKANIKHETIVTQSASVDINLCRSGVPVV